MTNKERRWVEGGGHSPVEGLQVSGPNVGGGGGGAL